MSLLTNLGRNEIAQQLARMSGGAARRDASEVEALLHGPWPEVRVAATEALVRGRIGRDALRTAARREKNDVVLAAICEALLLLDDKTSVPVLSKLARRHPSPLVRRHAAWAVSEILRKGAVPFLRSLERNESSRRVRATIKAALVKNGDQGQLPGLLKMLKSRDYLVRTSLANFFAENVRIQRDRALVARSLEEALAVEQSRAAAEALTRALARVTASRRAGKGRTGRTRRRGPGTASKIDGLN